VSQDTWRAEPLAGVELPVLPNASSIRWPRPSPDGLVNHHVVGCYRYRQVAG
jgi:hypothetical protein